MGDITTDLNQVDEGILNQAVSDEELETAGGDGTRVTNPTIVGTYVTCTYFPCTAVSEHSPIYSREHGRF